MAIKIGTRDVLLTFLHSSIGEYFKDPESVLYVEDHLNNYDYNDSQRVKIITDKLHSLEGHAKYRALLDVIVYQLTNPNTTSKQINDEWKVTENLTKRVCKQFLSPSAINWVRIASILIIFKKLCFYSYGFQRNDVSDRLVHLCCQMFNRWKVNEWIDDQQGWDSLPEFDSPPLQSVPSAVLGICLKQPGSVEVSSNWIYYSVIIAGTVLGTSILFYKIMTKPHHGSNL